MARPKQYPHAHYIRLSDEGNTGLAKRAKIMGVPPAVAGRIIIEHSVKGEPIPHVAVNLKKGDKDGPVQQKK